MPLKISIALGSIIALGCLVALAILEHGWAPLPYAPIESSGPTIELDETPPRWGLLGQPAIMQRGVELFFEDATAGYEFQVPPGSIVGERSRSVFESQKVEIAVPLKPQTSGKTYRVSAHIYRVPVRWMTRGLDTATWLDLPTTQETLGIDRILPWSNSEVAGWKARKANTDIASNSQRAIYVIPTESEALIFEPLDSSLGEDLILSTFRLVDPQERLPQ